MACIRFVALSFLSRLQMLANPGSSQQSVDVKELREKQALARSQLMRANAGYIPAFAVQQRRNFFTAKVRAP